MRNADIWNGKDLSGLLKDIYDNSVKKRVDIQSHIVDLMKLVKSATDAAVIAPIVATFVDIGNRNDEHLVKIATIVQRILSSEIQSGGADGGGSLLSEDEKKKLLEDAVSEFEAEVKKTDEEYKEVTKNVPNRLQK